MFKIDEDQIDNKDFIKFCEEQLDCELLPFQKVALSKTYYNFHSNEKGVITGFIPITRGDGLSMTKTIINTLMFMYDLEKRLKNAKE